MQTPVPRCSCIGSGTVCSNVEMIDAPCARCEGGESGCQWRGAGVLLHRARAFAGEQGALALRTPAIASNRAIRLADAVTRDDERDRIARACLRHGPRRSWLAD